MSELEQLLAERGGLARTSTILTAGVARARLRAAIDTGLVVRVRQGVIALPSVPTAELAAARVGGCLSCVSLLAAHRLWIVTRPGLHVSVPPTASRLRSPRDPAVRLTPGPTVTVHWKRPGGLEPDSLARDSVLSALLHLIECVPPADALVTIDSALNRGLVTLRELEAVWQHVPKQRRWLLDRADPKAESGLETRARWAFARRGIRVRTQVWIDDVRFVDLLIGDRLVLETDGSTFHDGSRARKIDYARDLVLFRRGYTCIRLGYQQVMDTWDDTEAQLLAGIRRGDHLWSAGQRRRNAG